MRFASSLAVLALAGCSLALPYALEPEQGDALCHDGVDDDLDGLIDCADDGCVRCVARPRIECPRGWTARTVGDPSWELHTCDRPDDVLDGCPSEAPPDAHVVMPGPNAVLHVLETLPIAPDPLAPPIDLWLEPGRHELFAPDTHESLELGFPLALHGLCRDGAHAVVAPAAGNAFALRPTTALTLDHVEMEVGAPAPAGDIDWHGSLVITHAWVHDVGGAGVPIQASSLGVTIDHARVESPLRIDHGRVDATEAELASIFGTDLTTTLDQVRVRGTVSLAQTSRLEADQMFVACGGVSVLHGAFASVTRSVLEGTRAAPALVARGDPAFPSVLRVSHTAWLTDASCGGDTPPVDDGIVLAEVTLDDVWVADAHGLAFADHTVAVVHDATFAATGVAAGLVVVGAKLTAERVRVSDAAHAGVEIGGDPRAATTVSMDGLYVEGVSAPSTCVAGAAGVALHVRGFRGGGTSQPVAVSLAHVVVDGVAGCGLFVDTGLDPRLADVEVVASDVALCAPTPAEIGDLASFVRVGAGVTPSDGAVACVGLLCAPMAGCGETDCGNGVDDDADGARDCLDDDCREDARCALVPEQCRNGIDDDHDGLIDCADDDCVPDATCGMHETDCLNGVDDDHDGGADCADTDCLGEPVCLGMESLHCDDGVDQDHDGAIDCADSDCAASPSCVTCGIPEACPSLDLMMQTGHAIATGTLDTTRCSNQVLSCMPAATGGALTFAWTAPTTGNYTIDAIDTSGMGFDPIVAVRGGMCDGAELACDRRGFPSFASSVTLPFVMGERVIVVLRSVGASVGEHYTLSINPG